MRMMEPPSDVEHGKNPYVSSHAAIGGGGGVELYLRVVLCGIAVLK
jgi:hypothetical protein